MRTRGRKFVRLCILIASFLWAAHKGRLLGGRQEHHLESHMRSQRRSVTLVDENFTYHLNLTQYEEEFPYLQSYMCTILEDRPGHCATTSKKPLLLLAIKSHPESIDRRAVLRQTWAAEVEVSGYQLKPLFLMATVPSPESMRLVAVEVKEYHDILQWNFNETHHNLSLKERCFLEWLYHNCKEAVFIFKGDDDEYVNPEAVVRYVKTIDNTSYCLYGALQDHTDVLRIGKYEITHSLFPFPKYPLFLSGGGFLFPQVVVPALYNVSIKLPVFPLDDVYLGILLLASNISLQHNPLIYTLGRKYDVCRFKEALVVHGISAEQLVRVWQEVHEVECVLK